MTYKEMIMMWEMLGKPKDLTPEQVKRRFKMKIKREKKR